MQISDLTGRQTRLITGCLFVSKTGKVLMEEDSVIKRWNKWKKML